MSANPLVNPEAWDTLIIAGEFTPGLAKVKAKRVHKWDEKKGKGSAGSTMTYAGHDLAEVDIEIRMWEQEQYDEWETKAPQWNPDPKNPKALDVIHPSLEILKIRSCVVLELGGVEIDPDGGMRVAMKIKEYYPPVPAGGTPKGSAQHRAPGDDPQTALTEHEKELAADLAEARKPL